MKILNLYCGIGGNRKLWGDEHEITAVDNVESIAKIYQDFFPNDKIIIADAHQYLLEHYQEFDFIWSSPPCPTHSRLRKQLSMHSGAKAIYPDMKLYEEVLFLQGYFKGKYCVENVIGWYKPLIPPEELQRHYFWTNFVISLREFEKDKIRLGGWGCDNKPEWIQVAKMEKSHGLKLPENTTNKRLLLRNCVSPEVGKHILECALGLNKQKPLF